MRGRHILAVGSFVAALVAGTRVGAEEAWWMPSTQGATLISPGGIEGLLTPLVIEVDGPYRADYSPAADFGERVKDCIVTSQPEQRPEELVQQIAFPTSGCTCEMHGCAAPATLTAMLPEACAERTAAWPAPHKLVAGALACTPECALSCEGAICPRVRDADARQRLEHILEAARHLEAAGLDDEAGRVRSHADADVRAVIEQLKAAQAALASWRQTAGDADKKLVSVEVQMVELNITKLRRAGCEKMLDAISGPACKVIDDDSELQALIDGDKFSDCVQVLSAPKLITASGIRATVKCGAEFQARAIAEHAPPGFKSPSPGTSIDILPVVLDDNHVRLELQAQFAEVDHSRDVHAGGYTIPGIRVRSACCTTEMNAGQACVTGGLVQSRPVVARGAPKACSAAFECSADNSENATGAHAIEEMQEFMFLVVVRPKILDVDEQVKPASAEVVEPCAMP